MRGGTIRSLPLLLIKPGSTLDEPLDRGLGYAQPIGAEMITEEIKAPLNPADECLIRVLLSC